MIKKSNKNLRHIFIIFIFFNILNSTRAWSTYFTTDNDHPHFAIKEEFICFEPIFDNTYVPTPTNGQYPFVIGQPGARKKNKFDYEAGYRFSAFYFNPMRKCLIQDVRLTFTYLPAYHTRKINSNSSLFNVSSSLGSTETEVIPPAFDSLFAHHHLHYYAGDLSFIYGLIQECHFKLFIEPGFHYVFMNYQNHVHFSATSSETFTFKNGDLKERSQTGGGGIQLGFGLNYQFKKGMTFKGLIKGGLLVSKSTVHFREKGKSLAEIPFHPIQASNDPLWRFLSFWEVKAGFNFSFSFAYYIIEMEVGYEYLTYPDFISRIRNKKENFPAVVNDLYSNVAFQGPYASLTIGF